MKTNLIFFYFYFAKYRLFPYTFHSHFQERTMGLSPKNSNAEERDAVETLLSISSSKCKDIDNFTLVLSNVNGTPPSPPYQQEVVRPDENKKPVEYRRESKLARVRQFF